MHCVTKSRIFIVENFIVREINTITEKLNTSTHPNNEHTLCQQQIKHLREENSSKIKILFENHSAFNPHIPKIFFHLYCMKWVPWDPQKQMLN